MIIDLNDNFDICEYIKVSAHGKNVETIDIVEISFSKEALMGFAKNLIWIYEDIDINKQFYVCTDPLGGVPSGNQVIGFYLTVNSPILTFNINSLNHSNGIEIPKIVQQFQSSQIKKCIEILPPVDENLMEEYELGFRNLARVSLFDRNHIDISKNIYEVLWEINYNGLKNLAIFLMRLLDIYQEGAEYTIRQDNNMGIILTEDSLPVKFKCINLGSVYDYEPGFGQ